MKLTSQEFKSTLNNLERLQRFKKPLTDFFDKFVYCNTHPTDDSLCEFYLLSQEFAGEENLKNIDVEVEETALKLARLLELKERQLKESLL